MAKRRTPAEQNLDTTHRECLAVTWDVLLLPPYLGHKFTMRMDDEALNLNSRITDAIGRLACCLVQLSYFDLDVVYWNSTMNQPAEAASGLKTGQTDNNVLENDLAEMMVSLFEQRRGKIRNAREGNFKLLCIWEQCDETVNLVSTALLKLVAFAHTSATYTVTKETPLLEAFLQAQAWHHEFKAATQTDKFPASSFTQVCSSVWKRQTPVDGALQKYSLLERRSCIPYLSHNPILAWYPRKWRMYDRVAHYFFWSQRGNRMYTTVKHFH